MQGALDFSRERYRWSDFQRAIFAAVEDPDGGNVAVRARAGTGKTTVICEAVRRMPRTGSTLVLAFIKVESNYDTIALSPKNAKGLMQLIPETAARFGVARPYDAEQNIRGGMAYLSWLMAYFEGNVPLVAAAYNAGEGAVNRYRGVPPYAETRAYVARILGGYGRVSHPFDAGVTGPSPQLPLMRAMLR